MRKHWVALVITFASLALMVSSVYYDSAIYDEPEHLTSGYSYIRYLDYRFNPWHPPLAKDLAALPLLFLDVEFPINSDAWTKRRREAIARQFFYHSGNDIDRMLLFSRTALILASCAFMWLFYRWVERRFGRPTALAALIFVALSPIFLAHSRYVTTDAAAAIGSFLALASYCSLLESPTWRRAIATGFYWGAAFLMKFSVLAVVPIAIVASFLKLFVTKGGRPRLALTLCNRFFLVGIIALVVVSVVYGVHMINFPVSMQARYNGAAEEWEWRTLAYFILATQDVPLLRGLSWFCTGLGRVLGFISVPPEWPMYFMGEAYYGGRWYYFPTLWMLKETPSFHAWSLIAIGTFLCGVATYVRQRRLPVIEIIRTHFILVVFSIYIVSYWTVVLFASINIGIRHVLPTLPFISLVSSAIVCSWAAAPSTASGRRLRSRLLQILLAGQGISVACAWPGFLGYFNALSLLKPTPSHWAIEANLDWGQDLRRLSHYVFRNDLKRVHVLYFGGGDPDYYLKERHVPWRYDASQFREGDYVAVSVHLLRMGQAKKSSARLTNATEDESWLELVEHVTTIGTSIELFRVISEKGALELDASQNHLVLLNLRNPE